MATKEEEEEQEEEEVKVVKKDGEGQAGKNKGTPFRGADQPGPYSIPSVCSLNNNSIDREICARGAVNSLRRFQCKEEEKKRNARRGEERS